MLCILEEARVGGMETKVKDRSEGKNVSMLPTTKCRCGSRVNIPLVVYLIFLSSTSHPSRTGSVLPLLLHSMPSHITHPIPY